MAMEKRTRMLMTLVILAVLIAIFLTYARSIVQKDFYIVPPQEGEESEQLE